MSAYHYLQRFYSFPENLRGALNLVPYFQILIYLPFIFHTFSEIAFGVVVICHLLLFPLFFLVFWCKGTKVTAIVLVLNLLGVITSFYSLAGIGFFAFAAAACSAYRKLYASLVLLCVVTFSYLSTAYLTGQSLYVVLTGLFFTAINGLNFLFQLRKYLSNLVIKQSQKEISSMAKTSERERIAQDLHDSLGQSLTSITLKAELAERLLEVDPATALQHILDIKKISRTAITGIRETVSNYKISTLANELASSKFALESVNITCIHHIEATEIPPQVDNTLAMTIREATTNILRHSQASMCEVSLWLDKQLLSLHVCDNGKVVGKVSMGHGLSGMSDRWSQLGGSLKIEFQGGCHIYATIPLK
ncbi:sensor histidine kinase [Microbulbifer sp. TRSA007]|uniref:sensor histidine kinase n=1 Tax=Microbulbifer sp. TRSA007 TaxID=3243384 RepID=UPI00403927C5